MSTSTASKRKSLQTKLDTTGEQPLFFSYQQGENHIKPETRAIHNIPRTWQELATRESRPIVRYVAGRKVTAALLDDQSSTAKRIWGSDSNEDNWFRNFYTSMYLSESLCCEIITLLHERLVRTHRQERRRCWQLCRHRESAGGICWG